MYQKTRGKMFTRLRKALVFVLVLALILPTMPVSVQAAESVSIPVPYINQGNYNTSFYNKNGKLVYNKDKTPKPATVKISGCGAASSAMVISYYLNLKGSVFSPDILFQRAIDHGDYQGNGLNHAGVSYICSTVSVNVTWTSSVKEAISALKENRPVIANVGESVFTTWKHYIVLTGYKKDNNGNEYFQVNDPNHTKYNRTWVSKSTVTKAILSSGYGITKYSPIKSVTAGAFMANRKLTTGSACNIFGYAYSNTKLKEVTGQILNSSGAEVQAYTVYPNANYCDLKSSDINKYLTFGSLAAGSYKLKITAKDSNGTVTKTVDFTVTAAAKLTGSVSMATTSIKKGKACNISGTIKSGSKITNVTGKIINSSGKAVQTKSISPNATSVNLKTSAINKNLKFGKLAKGKYKLQITAKDAAGNNFSKTISFTVK